MKKQLLKILLVKIGIILLITLALGLKKLQSQTADSIFRAQNPFTVSQTLSLSIDNNNLFINNEFFSPVFEGYTLSGSTLCPTLNYKPTAKAMLRFGMHVLHFSGDSSLKIRPIIGARFQISDEVEMNLGYLDGGMHHGMLEPLFHYERHFTAPVESGLQFLFNKRKWKSDIWINWEQFIEMNDPFQEIFTFGTSTEIYLWKNKTFSLSLPLQSIVTHQGGQINTESPGVETLANTAIGGKLLWQRSPKHQWFTEHYLLTYSDLSPTKRLPFIYGYGYYSVGGFSNKRISLEGGYWFGDYYITPRGMPLFGVYSKISGHNERQRSLIHSQFRLQIPIGERLNFAFRAAVFYDLYNSELQHYLALFITFNNLFELQTNKPPKQ